MTGRDESQTSSGDVLGRISTAIRREVSNLRLDLERLRSLLSGSVLEVAKSVRELTDLGRDQQVLLGDLLELARFADDGDTRNGIEERIARVEELERRLARAASRAVQSIQFEDLASQMAQHLRRRVLFLESFVASIEEGPPRSLPVGAAADVERDWLREAKTLLDEHEVFFRDLDRSSVDKESMEEGDVVLF